MAWQLHYTSARRGPTGRAGFQFVAETPGLPDGARAGVTPYLSYRPPPDAPLSPEAHELDRFPVALLYDRVAGRPLLLRCRYLGRDYSGRYGNFFAHAVVAEEEELEGLRPAELWHAPLWSDEPVNEGVLPPLEELSPGANSDPESLAEWLAAQGKSASGDAYGLLARLMDAVAEVLADGYGRVVLVSDDVEPIARWIAVVSYSLPVAAAAAMSFVTYSADPDGAAQRLVGTTPDVWAASQRQAGHVFQLNGDGKYGDGGAEPSRYARTVATCWREFDFAGLDALGELAPAGARAAPRALDDAATLLSLCRGDRTVTRDEEAAAARLIERQGARIPGWVWRDLAQGVPAMGLDLALAITASGGVLPPSQVRAAASRWVRDGTTPDLPGMLARVPDGLRDAVLEGVLSGLAESGRDVRRAVLTGHACEALYRERDRLLTVPAVAEDVLVTVASWRPGLRTAVTGDLLRLGGTEAIERVWREPPSAAECLTLLEAHPDAFASTGPLAGHLSRAFEHIAAGGHDALSTPDTRRLVARVRAVRPDPGGESGRAAAAIGAYTEVTTAERPERAAAALGALISSGAPEKLVGDVLTAAARRLAGQRSPRFRAALLAAAPPEPRSRLGALWAGTLARRTQRNELIEVVLRLRRLGVAEPALETWARSAAGRWLSARMLDAYFAGEPQLRAALKELVAEARGRGE
jgi:hypothetical protein